MWILMLLNKWMSFFHLRRKGAKAALTIDRGAEAPLYAALLPPKTKVVRMCVIVHLQVVFLHHPSSSKNQGGKNMCICICVLLYSGAWCLHLAWLPAGWLGEGTLPTLHMNTLIAAIWTLETQHGQIWESSDDIYCKGQVYVRISPKYKLGRQSQYEASVMKRGVGASRKVNKVAAKSLSRQKQKAT